MSTSIDPIRIHAGASVCAVIVSRIGDTLLVTPALRALRAACAHLSVLAHPQRMDVLRHLDFIDELAPITKNSAWFRSVIVRKRHDVAICWGAEPSLLRYCLRVADRSVVFDHPVFRPIKGQVLRVPVPEDASLHAVRERALLVEAASVEVRDVRLAYRVTEDERRHARRWIAQQGSKNGSLLVGLQPFSFPTKAHRDWPMERFLELARRLCAAMPNAHLIVLGDAAARERVSAFEKALPGRVTIAAGQLALRESAAVMRELALYVGVDTGPTHIAGALGIPMVALYHPRYPGRNLMPLDNPRCITLEGSVDAGMEGIEVDAVFSTASGLLMSSIKP